MRPVQSLSTAIVAATIIAATLPSWAAPEATPFRIAQAPASPPTSGWAAPGAEPSPPGSGWAAPAAPARPGPIAPPATGWSSPGALAGPQRDCGGEFLPLRQDAEKKAGAIKAAAARKRQPELCSAFRIFAAAEAKVVKFVEDNGAECRIPPDALKSMKGNHAKTVEVRNKICDAPAAGPRQPSLSDALGTSRIPQVPGDGAATKRGSTFDTMTGNPLAR